MESLQWVFELVEKVTGPAKKATEASSAFEKELKKVEEQIKRIEHHPIEFKKLQNAKKELRELSGGSKSFAERFEEMGAAVKRTAFVQNLMLGAEALHLMFEAGEKVFDVALDIGKELVNAAGHAERMGIAFKTLAGDDEGGEALEYIEKIKKASELSGAQLQEMGAQLLTAGFKAKELGNALPAALDVGGFLGGGAEHIEAAIQALAKIRESGKVGDKQLMHLGLGENSDHNLLANMSKAKGESIEAIKKAMEAGKLNPQEVLYQVYEMIIARQHGALGTTAEKMTQSVTGRLNKLKQLPEEIFEKWAASPGFAKFSKSLQKVLDKLDPDGPNGQKIFKALDKLALKVVDLVDKFVSGDGIDKFIAAVTDVDKMLGVAKSTLDTIVTVSEVIATIWAGTKIVGAVSSLVSLFPTLATGAGMATAAIGAAAVPILAVAAAIGAVVFAIKEWHDVITSYEEVKQYEKEYGITDEMKNKGDGQWKTELDQLKAVRDAKRASQGWAPIGSDAPPAPDVAASIPAPSLRAKPGASMSSTQTVNIQHGAIQITAPNGNPDEIASAVNQSLPGAVQQANERMAVSSGVM